MTKTDIQTQISSTLSTVYNVDGDKIENAYRLQKHWADYFAGMSHAAAVGIAVVDEKDGFAVRFDVAREASRDAGASLETIMAGAFMVVLEAAENDLLRDDLIEATAKLADVPVTFFRTENTNPTGAAIARALSGLAPIPEDKACPALFREVMNFKGVSTPGAERHKLGQAGAWKGLPLTLTNMRAALKKARTVAAKAIAEGKGKPVKNAGPKTDSAGQSDAGQDTRNNGGAGGPTPGAEGLARRAYDQSQAMGETLGNQTLDLDQLRSKIKGEHAALMGTHEKLLVAFGVDLKDLK